MVVSRGQLSSSATSQLPRDSRLCLKPAYRLAVTQLAMSRQQLAPCEVSSGSVYALILEMCYMGFLRTSWHLFYQAQWMPSPFFVFVLEKPSQTPLGGDPPMAPTFDFSDSLESVMGSMAAWAKRNPVYGSTRSLRKAEPTPRSNFLHPCIPSC